MLMSWLLYVCCCYFSCIQIIYFIHLLIYLGSIPFSATFSLYGLEHLFKYYGGNNNYVACVLYITVLNVVCNVIKELLYFILYNLLV